MDMQEALYIVGGLRQSACIDQYNDACSMKARYIDNRVNQLCNDNGWCHDQIVSLVNAKSDALIDAIINWHDSKPFDITPRRDLEHVLATEAGKVALIEWNEWQEAASL